jgi:hypothetical protein
MKVFTFFTITIILLNLINLNNSLFFDLRVRKTRCFIEELYSNNMAMFKYNILGMIGEDVDNQKTLNKIGIRVFSEDNDKDVFVDKHLVSKEGKISMTAPRDGQYRVCVTLHEQKDSLLKIKMQLAILSENMDEPNLQGAVDSEHVTQVHQKVISILEKGDKYNKKLQKIVELEDQDAAATIKSQKTFYYTTLIQIAIVIVLGIYQMMNLKKYVDRTDIY